MECLLGRVGVQVLGLDADVGPLKRPLEQAPEVLQFICVDVIANKLNCVVYGLVHLVGRTLRIRLERVGVHRRSRLGYGWHRSLHSDLLIVLGVLARDLTMLVIIAPAEHAHDSLFADAAGPLNRFLATCLAHVAGLLANEGLISFEFAVAVDERPGLHGEPDTVKHKPRCFLRHADPRWTSSELTPFLQSAIIQTAMNDLSRLYGLSSKIVPTWAENCLRGWSSLRSHMR